MSNNVFLIICIDILQMHMPLPLGSNKTSVNGKDDELRNEHGVVGVDQGTSPCHSWRGEGMGGQQESR